ncbi:MAG TPA: hypothetical protein VGW98_05180 [Solirubrobacteraceae bacterium]|nr:hypothetical protein [Solirubrobacteraceae bacterium]
MSDGVFEERVEARGAVARRPPAVGVLARVARAPAWTITAVLGLAYVIATPPSADLAAASYRSYLFGREGFTLWDNAWYAGHHLPAYSLIAPALGWLVGPPLLAAVSMTAATALFAALIERRFPERAVRVASAWFGLGAAIALLSSRVPFDLGLALGLGSLLAAQRQRQALALVLAALCALASPVAGAFLALAALAWALAGEERGRAVALAGVALAPILALVLLFPEGGTQPFVGSAFYPALAGVLLIAALVAPEHRVLRTGALLYAIALTGAFVLATAVGGNADRLGALAAGPVAALVLLGSPRAGRRPLLLLALAPAFLYWQANAPVADFLSASSDASVHASYYTPLLTELRALGVDSSTHPARVEVVATRDHWEARWAAASVMLARGWERQLDRYRNALFYEGSPALTPQRYHAWLLEQSVAYVALPDAPLDYSATAERSLLQGARTAGASAAGQTPPYLDEVWRSAHWRLFAVRDASPLATPPSVLAQAGHDSFTLRAPVAGTYTVRVHFTSYWALAGGRGCVSRAPGDWTRVQARSAGSLRVVIRFSLARVLGDGPRCG